MNRHIIMITDRWKWKYHSISSSRAYYTYNMVVPGMPFNLLNVCYYIAVHNDSYVRNLFDSGCTFRTSHQSTTKMMNPKGI